MLLSAALALDCRVCALEAEGEGEGVGEPPPKPAVTLPRALLLPVALPEVCPDALLLLLLALEREGPGLPPCEGVAEPVHWALVLALPLALPVGQEVALPGGEAEEQAVAVAVWLPAPPLPPVPVGLMLAQLLALGLLLVLPPSSPEGEGVGLSVAVLHGLPRADALTVPVRLSVDVA